MTPTRRPAASAACAPPSKRPTPPSEQDVIAIGVTGPIVLLGGLPAITDNDLVITGSGQQVSLTAPGTAFSVNADGVQINNLIIDGEDVGTTGIQISDTARTTWSWTGSPSAASQLTGSRAPAAAASAIPSATAPSPPTAATASGSTAARTTSSATASSPTTATPPATAASRRTDGQLPGPGQHVLG